LCRSLIRMQYIISCYWFSIFRIVLYCSPRYFADSVFSSQVHYWHWLLFYIYLVLSPHKPTSNFHILTSFESYVYWTVHHLDSWTEIDRLDVTCFIISIFTARHVSDVSTFVFRSLRLIVDLFHVLYCSGSMCVGVTVWFIGRTTYQPDFTTFLQLRHIPTQGYNITQSSAPDDGHMVARNMLSNY